MENQLAAVERAALEQNGWRVIAAALTHEGGDGYVPHGVCAFERDRDPSGRDLYHGTANFNLQKSGVTFDTGHYDLGRAEALADFAERLT